MVQLASTIIVIVAICIVLQGLCDFFFYIPEPTPFRSTILPEYIYTSPPLPPLTSAQQEWFDRQVKLYGHLESLQGLGVHSSWLASVRERAIERYPIV